jgi:hypothetical protein
MALSSGLKLNLRALIDAGRIVAYAEVEDARTVTRR